MKSEKNIEKLIANSTVDTDPAADRQRLAEYLSVHNQSRLNRPCGISSILAPAKLAAAVILLAVGFIVARTTSPGAVDKAQLEMALRTCLQQDIADIVADRFAQLPASESSVDSDKMAAAVWIQLQAEMPQLMATVLEASEARTEQRLKEMASAVDRARAQDRRQVAAAIEQIEARRLEDRYRIGQGLVRLAARTDNTTDFNQN